MNTTLSIILSLIFKVASAKLLIAINTAIRFQTLKTRVTMQSYQIESFNGS